MAVLETTKTPPWYPAWNDETVVIVGAGPSAAFVSLDEGIGRAKFVALNRSIMLCPWADIWYACDFQFWDKYYGDSGFHKEVGEYPQAVKVCVDYRVRELTKWQFKFLYCEKPSDTIRWEPGRVGWGGNSGFNALNMVAQLAPAKIILVGYDMTRKHGAHWHDPHPTGLSNPTNGSIDRWRIVTDNAAKTLAEHGLYVINSSEYSTLRNYAKMSFQEALDYVPGDPFPAPTWVPAKVPKVTISPERLAAARARVEMHLAKTASGKTIPAVQIEFLAERLAERI